MFEQNILIYSGIGIGVLVFGFLLIKFRTSYIKSLYDKINAQEENLGSLINQVANLKATNQDLEKELNNQTSKLGEMAQAQTDHGDKLSKSYLDNKELIQDLKFANKAKSELESKIAELEIKFEKDMDSKVEAMDRVESSYKKVSHSFEIMQKSNDNLREERDFYRNEFLKLRHSLSPNGSDSNKEAKLANM